MPSRSHPFFGVLTADAGGVASWRSKTRLADAEVRLELSLDGLHAISDDDLTRLARAFGRLEELDGLARGAMATEQHVAESSTALYVDFVEDNFEDARGRVIAGLVPVRLWAWVNRPEALHVVLDYSFKPDAMNHVLAVRFDCSARLLAIDLES